MKPEELRFARSHEWAHIEPDGRGGRTATVGISQFAVEQLTDLVYMELPQVGRQIKPGEAFGEIESVKAVSDLYSPVQGEVIDVNRDLPDHLDRLNTDPYGDGWIAKIRLAGDAGLDELLDYAAYQKQCEEGG